MIFRNTFYNLREGVKELEKSIQLGKEPRYPGDTKQPEFVAAHIKLAGLYLNKNYEVYNVELAEQHLKEALGDIQHRLQKKYTRKTERDISSLESIYLNLGKCALEKDDPQTAKEFFTKCIQESQSGEIRDNWYTEILKNKWRHDGFVRTVPIRSVLPPRSSGATPSSPP